MKKCPCCDKMKMNDEDVMNSLSHVDNTTYICNDCGQAESLIFLDAKQCSKQDADNYYRFKKRCKK